MAISITQVMDGLGLCLSTFWALQEHRFSAIFEALSSAARSVIMGLVFCFLSVHTHRGRDLDLGMAFI